MKEVTAVFDIGKTNKKCILFDRAYNEVFTEYTTITEIEDEDGFPCDDLREIEKWIKSTLDKIRDSDNFSLKAVNFSTYGASLVHLDDHGHPVTPLYNYLKPYPEAVHKKFVEEYGAIEAVSVKTASPFLGMLNSGLQLFWLKQEKPKVFDKIHTTLHFPQYLSYLFTGEKYSDFTSLGCHTMLWNFSRNNYHTWVYKEGLDRMFAPLVATDEYVLKTATDGDIQYGIGIHDSSAALLPYIKANSEPFLLLSTGTWSIALNPYSDLPIARKHLVNDCLNFLRIDGKPVRASRLFLGKHLEEVLKTLNTYFEVDDKRYKALKWNDDFVSKRKSQKELLFDHGLIGPERFGFTNNEEPDYSIFDDYEDALMHLFDELTDIQIASMKLAVGKTNIKRIYIDGGFSANEVFVQFIANKLEDYQLFTSSSPSGSALGAAMIFDHKQLPEDFLDKNYQVSQIAPTHESRVASS